MRSEKARAAAKRHKKRPPSELRPDARRTRNADQRGKDFMEWCKQFPCVVCYKDEWDAALEGNEVDWAWLLYCGMYKPHTFPPQETPTEFAHIDGNAAAKASNFHGIPISRYYHREDKFCQENLKRKFGKHWGIDIPAIIRRLRKEFDATHPKVSDASVEPVQP